MRVLSITNTYPTPEMPWLGTFVEQQIIGLRSVGVETQVLYFNRNKEGPFIYYRMGRLVSEAIAAFRPHLLHVMYGGVMADRMTHASLSIPVVVTFHGSDLLGENLSGIVRKLVSRYGVRCSWRAARRASGIVVVARHLEQVLPGDLDRRKMRVIPCGIDLTRFKPMDREACRLKLGWAAGTYHILFPANAGDPVKRPWLARAAIESLHNKDGIKGELHMLSGVPYADVPTWLNASDALVLTSLQEGSPTVVKEALACNVPVVSVDVGDVAERIAGIEGCHLVGAEPEAIALGLLDVWKRKCRVDSADLMRTLSIETIAERLKSFYSEILQPLAARRSPQLPEVEAL
jgi:teichuronic acid biosynthesis glycosyltransferase TuaC